MTGFSLTEDGDVEIARGDIQMLSGTDLLTQTVRQVLSTNRGEWEYNADEGINLYAFLRKNPEDEEIRDNIRSALLQVDDTFTITSIEITRQGRSLSVPFTAKNSSEQEIKTEVGTNAVD